MGAGRFIRIGMRESYARAGDLASMHTDALAPEDKIETFIEADAHALGVETRTTFVSCGPIGRLNGGTTALTVKLRVLTGPGGTREFFEVTHSPIMNFDLHALAQAAERASMFVGDAQCVDFSTMFHSDWEAVAREVATPPEPFAALERYVGAVTALVGEFERGPLSVGVDVADYPDRTAVTLIKDLLDGRREIVDTYTLDCPSCAPGEPCGFAKIEAAAVVQAQVRLAQEYVELDALETAYHMDASACTQDQGPEEIG